MNIATLAISRNQARRELRSIRAVMHTRAEQEYRHLERVYTAASGGATLIDIGEAFRATGFHGNGWPKIAIAKADAKRCEFGYSSMGDGWAMKFGERWQNDTGGRKSVTISVPTRMATPPVVDLNRVPETWARVPLIPARIIEQQGPTIDLSRFHILFEAQWQVQPKAADPYLLRRVSRYVFAIVAQWDVTPIEALVVGQLR